MHTEILMLPVSTAPVPVMEMERARPKPVNKTGTPTLAALNQRAVRGLQVRCDRDKQTPASWQRWQGREGTVVALNSGEIGVRFAAVPEPLDGKSWPSADAWFLPSDLVKL